MGKREVLVIHTPPDLEFHGTIEFSGNTGSRISGRLLGTGGLPEELGIVSFEGEIEITGGMVMFWIVQNQLDLIGHIYLGTDEV